MHYKALKIASSAAELHGYGLQIATTMPFPKTFMDFAYRNSELLKRANDQKEASQKKSQMVMARKKSVVELYEALVHLNDMPGDLDQDTLRKWLIHLQYKFINSAS